MHDSNSNLTFIAFSLPDILKKVSINRNIKYSELFIVSFVLKVYSLFDIRMFIYYIFLK